MLEIEIMVIRIRIRVGESDSRHAEYGSQRPGTDVVSSLNAADDGRIGKKGANGAIGTFCIPER